MKTTFTPAIGLQNPHLQTLYPTFFNKEKVTDTEIEIFQLPDGDFVECVWKDKPIKNSTKPIVTLFHGLAGGFHSPYIQHAMIGLSHAGFSVVVMQFRGCGTMINKYARSYHSGETEDAKAWIKELYKRFPKASLFGVGYSLGGNMLLKLMGELGDKTLLKGIVSISAPMQLELSSLYINQGFSKIYQYHLMQNLKKDLLAKYKLFDIETLTGFKKKDISKLTTFWEFDDAYTAPIHGFKDAKEYYEKSSAKQYLKFIKRPTLIIHALDDPFMPPKILPKKDEISPSIKLKVSKHGGHVGFVSCTILNPKYWLKDSIINFLKEQL
jgi:predicted alpha/beta-fold hydrolase